MFGIKVLTLQPKPINETEFMKVKEPICIMVATGSSCLEVPQAYSVTRQTYEKTFQQPNYVKFGVMLNDRYVCTMRYRQLPVFTITEK